MSRTWKDRPYRLGGNRHKYFIANSHGSHGRFTRLMRKLTRAFLRREMIRDPDSAAKKSYRQKEYFD